MITKLGQLAGGVPPIHKQLKSAIVEGNEDKAITLFMTKDGSKVHLSKPFPTKKIGANEDTPMHLAARYALFKLFKMFLEYGGHPGCWNERKENCAHALCQMTSFPSKRADLVDLIFEWRGIRPDNTPDFVDINHTDADGNTALHIAAYNGLVGCVEKLVFLSADLSLRNFDHLTSCDVADKANNFPVAAMLELAKIFQPEDELKEATQMYRRFTADVPDAKLIVDSKSITLGGLIEFINKSIKVAVQELNETPARAEVLLNSYSWVYKQLKKDYTQNALSVLARAKIKARNAAAIAASTGYGGIGGKQSAFEFGIAVEDLYFDPSYASMQTFTVYHDGKKKIFNIRNYDGKVGVYPNDYDPAFRYLDSQQNISETSHIHPKTTESCKLCGTLMLEAAGIQHFITGSVVEPIYREIACASGHKFCFSCWGEHSRSLLKNDHGSSAGALHCPSPDCGEILDLQWAPIILKKADMVNRLIAQRQKYVINSLRLHWCPVQDCGLLVRVDDSQYQFHGFAPPRSAICENNHSFCLECSNEAHSPCSCKNLQFWQDSLKEEARRLQQVNPPKYPFLVCDQQIDRNCLQCGFHLDKPFGCNIAICFSCQKQRCWVCLEDWSLHGKRGAHVTYCNRFVEKSMSFTRNNDGMFEEKADDSAGFGKRKNRGSDNDLVAKFMHYGFRYKLHTDSAHRESEMKLVVMERIFEALKATQEGQYRWLQGDQSENPLELSNKDKIEKIGHKEVAVEDFFLTREEGIEFLWNAFTELEKSRSFLRWSYPFVFLELESFGDNDSSANMSSKRERVADMQVEFVLLQGALEYNTELLSDAIARNRVNATKLEIDSLTAAIKLKRIEMEKIVLAFYSIQKLDKQAMDNAETPQESQKSRHFLQIPADAQNIHGDQKVNQAGPGRGGIGPLESNFSMGSLNVPSADSSLTSWTKPSPSTDMNDPHRAAPGTVIGSPARNQSKREVSSSSSNSSSSEDSDEDEDYGNNVITKVAPRTKSFVIRPEGVGNNTSSTSMPPSGKVPINNANPNKAGANQGKDRIIDTLNADGSNMDELLGLDTVTTTRRTSEQVTSQMTQMMSMTSTANITTGKVVINTTTISSSTDSLELDPASGAPARGLVRIGSIRNAKPEEIQRIKILGTKALREPPPIIVEQPEEEFYDDLSEEGPVVEQRLIGAKKDPDEEALEHAILISKQEEEFGINMYDALTEADEPLVEEYMMQGFTREEAILIVFEENFGKVSILKDMKITPAMPTLHKVDLGYGPVSEDDEPEIEYFMAKGFTREQAIEVMFNNRKKAEEQRQTDERLRQEQLSLQTMQTAYSAHSSSHGIVNHAMSRSAMSFSAGRSSVANPRLQQLLDMGYTTEQATALIATESGNIVQQSTTTVSHLTHHQSHSQFEREVDAYDDFNDDDLDLSKYMFEEEDDPEVTYMMSQGYTREQAIGVLHSSSDPSPPSSSSAHNNLNIPGISAAQESEIRRFMNLGFTRDQATQQVLGTISSNIVDVSPIDPESLPGAYPSKPTKPSNSSTNSTSSSTAGRPVSSHNNHYQSSSGNYGAGPSSAGEDAEMERVIRMSEQEAEFGANMYDSLTAHDQPEVDNLMGSGYSYDDALLVIFYRRYCPNRPPPLPSRSAQPPQQQHIPPPQPSAMPIASHVHDNSSLSTASMYGNMNHNSSMYGGSMNHNSSMYGSSMYGSSNTSMYGAPPPQQQQMLPPRSHPQPSYQQYPNSSQSYYDPAHNYQQQQNGLARPQSVFVPYPAHSSMYGGFDGHQQGMYDNGGGHNSSMYGGGGVMYGGGGGGGGMYGGEMRVSRRSSDRDRRSSSNGRGRRSMSPDPEERMYRRGGGGYDYDEPNSKIVQRVMDISEDERHRRDLSRSGKGVKVKNKASAKDIKRITKMGFKEYQAIQALEESDHDVETAIRRLLG